MLLAAVEAAVAQVVIVEAAVGVAVVGVLVVELAMEEAVEAAVVGAAVAEVVMLETAVAAAGAPVVEATVVDPLETAYRNCNRSADSSMRSRATQKQAGNTGMFFFKRISEFP